MSARAQRSVPTPYGSCAEGETGRLNPLKLELSGMNTPYRRILLPEIRFNYLASFYQHKISVIRHDFLYPAKIFASQPALPSESSFLPTRDRSPVINIYCHAIAKTASAILAILLVKLQKLSEITILRGKKLPIIAQKFENSGKMLLFSLSK